MRARTGKIARLPAAIRHELNRRLHNGALGRELVPWLNTLPEVQSVLAHRFASRPITEDNISAWRRGGFRDWLLDEERRARLGELAADCPEIDPGARTRFITARAEERLALELAEELERLSTITDPSERWKNLQRLSREMCRLHRVRTHEKQQRLSEVKSIRALNTKKPIRDGRFHPESALFGPLGATDHGGGGSGSGVPPVPTSQSATQHSTPATHPINNSPPGCTR
jgi:hypothetical protein